MSQFDKAQQFHEQWLGYVQPIDGLMFSIPVLKDAQAWQRIDAETAEQFVHALEFDHNNQPYTRSITHLFKEFLGYADDDLLVDKNGLPERLYIYAAEGRQEIRPTFALRDYNQLRRPLEENEHTPASEAGMAFNLLAGEIPRGMPFDTPESTTGDWHYPPAKKFERLLRQSHVPMGLLSNGDQIRFIYAPHGEATGSITWSIADMARTDGRPILSAFYGFFEKDGWGASLDGHVLSLLRASRERQTNVTTTLANQVYEAIHILLAGFAAADERVGTRYLQEAIREHGEGHIYNGLLNVLLRLVFVLYAEERSLLPIDNTFYEQHLSLLRLFEELRDDAGKFPETMIDRRGAWPRLLALFRAIFFGAQHRELQMPARQGSLFDPERFPFLEGWTGTGGAPHVGTPNRRAQVKTPQIDDGVIYQVLRKLLIVDGERLSYRSLDVEQIGSVYERLMGYHVMQLTEPAVCLKPKAVWVSPSELKTIASSQLTNFLKDEARVPKSAATRLAKLLRNAKTDEERLQALRTEAYANDITGVIGQFVIQPGDERRRTSSHYTPRSLTTDIVQRTLDPLMAALGEHPSSQDILDLKICDPAMGSGAFLVECCRYLGRRLEAAWTYEGVADDLGDRYDNLENHARRMIAQRCLYGVDKNPMAVDLARVSLWLVTLSRNLPFTFVDHALRHGDSVVGLSLAQARSFHWTPDKQQNILLTAINKAMTEAIELRHRIVARADDESEQAQVEKSHLLDDAEFALERARLIADVAIGAFFSADKAKARNDERKYRAEKMRLYLEADPYSQEAQLLKNQLLAWQREIQEEHAPFHWMLEFPEIFYAERRDPLAPDTKNGVAYMDAFVGNPPFGGKNMISANGGPNMISWLQTIHPGAHGNADYSAHFFRRCASMLGANGTIGLIATNTIGQGDTRATGLQVLVRNGYDIYAAEDSKPWPGEAAVTISTVFLAKGTPRQHDQQRQLNGEWVEHINSRLKAKPERPDPVKLLENANQSFVGCYVLGMGFTLTPAERDALVAKNPHNAERIFPYLGGDEVNNNPDQGFDRYVIHFGQMSLAEAERWPDLIEVVRQKVKPERDKKNSAQAKKYWWQFLRIRVAMTNAITPLERCLVTARVSNTESQYSVDRNTSLGHQW